MKYSYDVADTNDFSVNGKSIGIGVERTEEPLSAKDQDLFSARTSCVADRRNCDFETFT